MTDDSLHRRMLADLVRSGLDGSDAETMKLKVFPASEMREISGNRITVAAYRLPYFDTDRKVIDFARYRMLGERRKFGDVKSIRYWQPPDTLPRAYLCPLNKKFDDSRVPLLVVEGEKKSAQCAKSLDYTAIGLGGVYNFGSRKRGIELLEELKALAPNREVLIAFDGGPNPDVERAAQQCAHQLTQVGARVWIIDMPPGQQVDEYLVKHGRDAFERLPRHPFESRLQIQIVRNLPKVDRRTKNARISEIVQIDMRCRGTFHAAGGEPLYFDRTDSRLHTLSDQRDPKLRAHLNQAYGLNGSEQEFNFVYEDLRAYALQHGKSTDVPMFSSFDKQRAVLWLYGGQGKVFRITGKGWNLVPNGTDGVLFRDFDVEFVVPTKRPSEAALRNVLEIPNFRGGNNLSKPQQKLLYELNWWSLFFPSLLRTRPLLLLDAVKGSGKTTGGRAIGTALFGSRFDVQAIDRDHLDDTVVALVNNPLVVLDNLDGRLHGLENLLAIASTGGQVPRRVLYTTMQEAKFQLRARVIATSRQPDVFARDDVRDRTLVLSLERLQSFRAEAEIMNDVLKQRPALWAYLLQRLPAIITALSRYKAESLPYRLADFAQFGFAVASVLGYTKAEIASAFDDLEAERDTFASERSNILQALQHWVTWQRQSGFELGCREKTAGELFDLVCNAWPRGQFPFHRPDAFGLALKNEESMLRGHFEITRKRGRANKTLITIAPRGGDGE